MDNRNEHLATTVRSTCHRQCKVYIGANLEPGILGTGIQNSWHPLIAQKINNTLTAA